MTLREALGAVDVLGLSGPVDVDVVRVDEDSRRVGPGVVFAAVVGTGRDGHDFIEAAVRAGASAVLHRRELPPEMSAMHPGCAFVRVVDPRRTASLLAFRLAGVPRPGQRVFAITGTNGKTTTAHLLASILEAAGRGTLIVGTTGHSWPGPEGRVRRPTTHTTPDASTLAALLREAHVAGAVDAVMEASSHGLHQGRAWGLPFSGVGFTNLGRDHLDYHGTVEAYGAAKALLLDDLRSYGVPGAEATFFVDDPFLAKLAEGGGLRVSARVQPEGATDLHPVVDPVHNRDGTRVRVGGRFGLFDLHVPLLGVHNLHNALVAAGMALAAGASVQAVQRGLESCAGAPGRLERIPAPAGAPLVLVDFAHTAEALAQVLAVVRPLVRGKLVCVFGCGGDRDRGKRPLMAAAAAAGADLVVMTSDNPRSEDPQRILDEMEAGLPPGSVGARLNGPARVARVADRRSAIAEALRGRSAEDAVIVAGKGHERTQEIAGVFLPFDDGAVTHALLWEGR